MDTTIELLTSSIELDDYGVQRQTILSHTIFARKRDITRSEFYNTGREGLNPSMMFLVFYGDYSGESIIRHEGKTYAVYRTYHVPGTDDLEIYVRREGGTNGKN